MATKTLGILVEAQGAAQAAGLIGKVDQSVQKLGSRSGMLGSFGSKMGYAARQIGGLAGAIGPMLGVAGITGLTAAFASSIEESATFGSNVAQLTKLTGMSSEATSAMVDTLDKWGVTGERQIGLIGKLLKNTAALAGATNKQGGSAEAVTKATENLRVAQLRLHEIEGKRKVSQSSLVAAQYRVADAQRKLNQARKTGSVALNGAAKFEQQYGFSITTTNGKIADANTLLLRAADYFNSNATATDKATVLSKLYGKQWMDMIPILSKGSAFIKDQEKNAIHLTDTQLSNITKFRTAQREFADTIGDLQVKIGAELMPSITAALQTVGTWLDTHSDEVVQFFKGAADFGAQIADGAGKAFAAIQAGWDMVPGPLKTLLIEGFAAGKVSKFLFNFGPMDLAKALTGGLTGGIFQRGGSPASPVFVADVTGGGGGVGDVAGLAGRAGLVTAAAGIAATALGSYALITTIQGLAAQELASGARQGAPQVNLSGSARYGGAFPMKPYTASGGAIGDYGAPHPGYGGSEGAIARSLLPSAADQRKNLAMQAILQRATAAGFRPTQAAVTATYERDVARSTALTARRSEELKTAIQANASTIVAGITAAIRGIPGAIVNVNVTASDIQKVVTQRRTAVRAHGSRNSLVGANEFG